MARLTNAELNRLLIESQQANAALRQELSIARADLERVRYELAQADGLCDVVRDYQEEVAHLTEQLIGLQNQLYDAARTLQSGSEQEQAHAAQQAYRAAAPKPAKRPYTPCVGVRDESLRERMARARELAMKTGRAVRLELA